MVFSLSIFLPVGLTLSLKTVDPLKYWSVWSLEQVSSRQSSSNRVSVLPSPKLKLVVRCPAMSSSGTGKSRVPTGVKSDRRDLRCHRISSPG